MSDDRNQDKKPATDDRDCGRSSNGKEGGEKKGRTTAEWVSLFVSVAIVLALVGGLIYQIFARGSRPPIIEVKPLMEEVRQEGSVLATIRSQPSAMLQPAPAATPVTFAMVGLGQ